jgi:hypothetical protein
MITPDIIDEVFTNIMPSSAKQAMGMEVTEEDLKQDEQIDKEKDAPVKVSMKWEDDALDKVSRIPIPFIRNMAVKRIEQEVTKAGEELVTMELFEQYRFTF